MAKFSLPSQLSEIATAKGSSGGGGGGGYDRLISKDKEVITPRGCAVAFSRSNKSAFPHLRR